MRYDTGRQSYQNINQYPANPYLAAQPPVPGWNPDSSIYPNAPAQGAAPGQGDNPWFDIFNQMSGGGGGGAGGWWRPGGGGGGAMTGGAGWAQKMYSPEFLEAMKGMYSQMGAYQPPGLAEQYKDYMEKSPELEQMEYNRALARLKGQVGTGQQNLMALAGARRGGANSGMFTGGLQDLNRELMRGTGEIATQQTMQNIADRERRMNQYLGYQQGDIGNQMGWLGQQQGFLQGMMPYEQFNIQFPQQMALQRGQLGLQRSIAEEQANAARRAESMGWLDRLMGWQGQLGNQYYTGQGQWGNYMGQRGGAGMGGYGPQWMPY